MAENTKKIAEISVILGIDEQTCRTIAKEYDEILPCKKIGKVSVYEDNTVDRFRKIADLQAQGLPKEVIIPAIRGGKSLQERAHVLCVDTVSYTHLTLPTILLVQISVVAVSLKKKNTYLPRQYR
eukprot:TRINITY_DN11622_c0_g1_i3.p1 TRINITY_DN11622_c0_g1~~TRINITY_DN11622_c0_g1_i3.p1  ORF type:complete len:125 (+),score=36.35 TRINITY_DN11622_c0_g1_i3:231-605(+)